MGGLPYIVSAQFFQYQFSFKKVKTTFLLGGRMMVDFDAKTSGSIGCQ